MDFIGGWLGGHWDTPLNFQHFQLNKNMAKLCATMEPQVAQAVLLKVTHYFNKHKKLWEQVLCYQLEKEFRKKCTLVAYYQQDPKRFNKVFEELTWD